MPTRYLTAVANNTEKSAQLALGGIKSAGMVYQRDNNTLYVLDPDGAGFVAIGTGTAVTALVLAQDKVIIGDAAGLGSAITLAQLMTALVGVKGAAAGYKIARGVHQQAAASDTIAAGLTTVVAVIATFRDTPTAKQTYLTVSIGDQVAAPVAGSFLSKTFKSTYAAADDFTDNLSFNWIAIGT